MLSEDEFPKYPSVKRVGHPKSTGVLDGDSVLLQEKMDGSNFRFTYHDDGLVFGSRNTVLNQNGSLTPEDSGSHDIGGQFEGVVDYILNNIGWKEIQFTEDTIFFGENMYPHTVDYNFESAPRFLGFDAYYVPDDRFVEPETTFELFENLELPTVPTIDKIPVDEFDPTEYKIPQSQYRNGPPEGIIMTNPDGYPSHRPVKAKRWTEEFAEKHNSAKNPTNEQADTDTDKFVRDYITEQRIRNNAHALVENEEWSGFQMEMMEDLPMKVIEDTWDEEYEDIVRTNLEIDMGEMRSQSSSKCATVLQRVIRENAGK